MYQKTLLAGWADVDFNAHMRNTAYLDKSVDVRMMYFADSGFPMTEFLRLRFGPVVMRDEVEYFREVRLLEEVTVALSIAGLSEDASRFVIRNEFTRADGRRAARVTSTGGWLDLTERKLIVPPEKIAAALRALTHSDDFVDLPVSVRSDA